MRLTEVHRPNDLSVNTTRLLDQLLHVERDLAAAEFVEREQPRHVLQFERSEVLVAVGNLSTSNLSRSLGGAVASLRKSKPRLKSNSTFYKGTHLFTGDNRTKLGLHPPINTSHPKHLAWINRCPRFSAKKLRDNSVRTHRLSSSTRDCGKNLLKSSRLSLPSAGHSPESISIHRAYNSFRVSLLPDYFSSELVVEVTYRLSVLRLYCGLPSLAYRCNDILGLHRRCDVDSDSACNPTEIARDHCWHRTSSVDLLEQLISL